MVNGVGRGMGVLNGVVIVEEEGAVLGEFRASHCDQWCLCDALFSNYFEDLFQVAQRIIHHNAARLLVLELKHCCL